MSEREKRYRTSNAVIGNNAVRLETAYPLEAPEVQPVPKQKPSKREVDIYRVEPRKDVNYAKINSLCTIVLAFVIIATLGVLVLFLKSHFSVTDTNTRIEQLKIQINQVRRENIQMQEELDGLVNLEYVYEVATTRLGMHVPGEDEVFYIDNDPVTYTTKYGPVEVTEKEGFSLENVWEFITRGW